MPASKRVVDQVQARGLLDSNKVTVAEHYEIERKKQNILGAGGFGVVWKGVDKRSNKTVAVKQMPKIGQTERFFQRERQFMQQCKHQNIVQLFDVFEDTANLHYFFVLELCDGNLDEVAKDKDIHFRKCMDYMMEVTEGVRFMHGKDIGHRDIKPTNVLVKGDRCLKLADFGLSKRLTDSTSGTFATAGVGSAPWMAPEVAPVESSESDEEAESSATNRSKHSRRYGLSIDIFSLGLLFLSIITHRLGRHLTAHKGNNLV